MHTTNRYSVGTCIHAAATAAATTTKTAMALRILGSSVRNWWQGLGRNESNATASSWVHENEQAAYGRHVSIAGGPAGVAAHYVSPVALRRRLSAGLISERWFSLTAGACGGARRAPGLLSPSASAVGGLGYCPRRRAGGQGERVWDTGRE